MEKKYWYAALTGVDDGDLGTGSFDVDRAIEIAKSFGTGCSMVVEVDANYDVNGFPTTDYLVVSTLFEGEDY